MAKPRGAPVFIDGKRVFYRYYREMGSAGSFEKVASWYLTEYGDKAINPNTGKPFTRMAMLNAAWRWVIRGDNRDDFSETHLEEARKIYEEYWLNNWGEQITYYDPKTYKTYYGDAAWKRLINKTVNRLVSSNGRKKWFGFHPEYIVIPEV